MKSKKTGSNRRPGAIFLLTIAAAVTVSLHGCVRDGVGDCELAIDVSFYSQTSCQTEKTYPEGISDLLVCLFDSDGILADYRMKQGVAIGPDYVETVSAGSEGIYYVDAWAGIDDPVFEPGELRIGGTKRSDLLFRLRRAQGTALPTQGKAVYFGESLAVNVAAGPGNDRPQASVNLKEVTNRLTVTVEGLLAGLEDYEVDIESDNGSMTVGGKNAPDDVIRYDRTERNGVNTLVADFTLLRLDPARTNTLIVTNTRENRELLREDLLEELLLKNPQLNLDCDHDFTIRLTAGDIDENGTYTIIEVWVNDWQVSSYDMDN